MNSFISQQNTDAKMQSQNKYCAINFYWEYDNNTLNGYLS